VNLKSLTDQYYKSPQFRKLAHTSQKLYTYAINSILDHFRGVKITDIKRSDVMKMTNSMSDKPASANLILRVASVLFSFAMDIDELPYNPASRVRKLKIGSHSRWHPEEIRTAIAHKDRIISVAIALAWYTGQREGDILGLQWKDFKNGYINLIQTKTRAEIGVKVHPELEAILSRIKSDEPDHFFIVSGRKSISGQAFRGRFLRATNDMGVYKTFHGIRKGVASELAERGRSTKEIAAILGHKTTRMAEYYAEQACGKKLASNAVDSMSL
jgi:integrase